MKDCVKSYWVSKNRIKLIYFAGILFLLLAALMGISLGTASISFNEIIGLLNSGFDSPAGRIMLYVRIPRTSAAIVCGAALAVSGAVTQGVLANNLASPSIIGVNAGAGLAVTLCSASGILGGWQMALAAFVGAFVTVMFVSIGTNKWNASRGTVILIGVALNSLLGAVSDTVITFAPDVGVMSRDFKIGDFSSVTYPRLITASAVIIVSFVALHSLSRELDVLTLGDESAGGLGMNTGFVRLVFLLLTALLAGSAVSICGLLSFVGLLVPHAVRRVVGSRAVHLLPLCALFGGGFVCFCDTLARVMFSPYEIPVGIIMAFLGAPFFIFVLIRGKGGHGCD